MGLTLKELKTSKAYRLISDKELASIINLQLSMSDYQKLKGIDSRQKAKFLKEYWNNE